MRTCGSYNALVEVDPRSGLYHNRTSGKGARIRAHNAYPALQRYLVLQPPVPPAILHQYLSAGDLGVVAIPPTPSQVFRTPVKSAHYWAAGLPLVIPAGVSDDADIAAIEGVGIVVPDILSAILRHSFGRFDRCSPPIAEVFANDVRLLR